ARKGRLPKRAHRARRLTGIRKVVRVGPLRGTGRGSLRPPAASRCSARTSLRAPFRGDPPRRAFGGRGSRTAPPHRALTISLPLGVSRDAYGLGVASARRRAAKDT